MAPCSCSLSLSTLLQSSSLLPLAVEAMSDAEQGDRWTWGSCKQGSLKPLARDQCQVTALQGRRQAEIWVAGTGVLRSQLAAGTRGHWES